MCIRDRDTLIIDAKSGTSGAGRGAKLPNLFCEVNENIKAYCLLYTSFVDLVKLELDFTGHIFLCGGDKWYTPLCDAVKAFVTSTI